MSLAAPARVETTNREFRLASDNDFVMPSSGMGYDVSCDYMPISEKPEDQPQD